MPDFPLLQSGSSVQYPFSSSIAFSTEIIRFVDGSEQRFSQVRDAVRLWTIALNDLTPGEGDAVASFADQAVANNQSFLFHDPLTGEIYPQCQVLPGPVLAGHVDEHRAFVSLTVEAR